MSPSPIFSEHIFSHSRSDLEQALLANGFSPSHAKPLYQHTFGNGAKTQLPDKVIRILQKQLEVLPLEEVDRKISKYDESCKFLFRLHDGKMVETVLMPEANRVTVCVSSQVGCAQACTFCHTGRMGLIRNLSVSEIIGQVYAAQQALPNFGFRSVSGQPLTRVTNVVFMGMGEPLDNVAALCSALRILMDPAGFGIAPRRLTVSTAGHLDGLRQVFSEGLSVSLALSLHSPFSAQRSQLMPINRRYPLEEVIAFLRANEDYYKPPVFIQYTMIKGVNDDPRHADELVSMCAGLPIKVNIIPFNTFDGSTFNSPSRENISMFRSIFAKSKIRTMVRYSKGQDISAACGQLLTR